MKILLTGATGYVGRHLLGFWENNGWDVHAISRNTISIQKLFDSTFHLYDIDICEFENMEILMAEIKPDVVIHTAGMSKPNDCELQQNDCFNINVLATEQLSFLCKEYNAYLIFLSTDFVF